MNHSRALWFGLIAAVGQAIGVTARDYGIIHAPAAWTGAGIVAVIAAAVTYFEGRR